jgi:N-acetylmuramoyl-L-alanine amidase
MSKKILISVGHGKNSYGKYDSGAVSKDGKYQEHKIAREIAKYAAEYLGCEIINYKGDLSLPERIKKVNMLLPDFAAEIHLNAGGGTGTETFYYHGSPTGKKAAEKICKNIAEEFKVKNRGSKVRLNSNGKDYFGFIRQTKPCAILIETLFIDCPADLEKIKTKDGMKKCGEAIGKALEDMFAEKENQIVTAGSISVKRGAGDEYEKIKFLKKGDKFITSVTSYDGKWIKLKDGGWIKNKNGYRKENSK